VLFADDTLLNKEFSCFGDNSKEKIDLTSFQDITKFTDLLSKEGFNVRPNVKANLGLGRA